MEKTNHQEAMRMASELGTDALGVFIRCMKAFVRWNELLQEFAKQSDETPDDGFIEEAWYELQGRSACGSKITDACCVSCIDRMEEAVRDLEKQLNILTSEKRQ